ncbi:hypothetical protein KDK_60090 [Dictyobacter kobayashii]|uniref:Uncharacterized protein n=1 Tax=Dictyobacter kobayashii TaxID=2014872 RepID=A0A402ASZ9_9CHLR|nr:hypothetical protein KDK_60090 [Dictyobacter kobayashii]
MPLIALTFPRTKLNWWKLGGEISTRQWNDIVEVIKRTRDALDTMYLRQFAPQLGVIDILEQVLIDAER